MNSECKKTRKLILTDYLDEQIGAGQEQSMKLHLARCVECKRFFEQVKKTALEPFMEAEKFSPPASVWRNIKETIIADRQRKLSPFFDFRRILKKIHYTPVPVFSFATAVLLIIIVGLTVRFKFVDQQVQQATLLNGQTEYFIYSVDNSGGIFTDGEASFGTPIEKYFL